MHPKHFSKHLQHDGIVAAIHDAEHKTTGQIRVVVSSKHTDDAVAAAQKEFLRLGMNQSPDRNGVLIFVAPRTSLPSSATRPSMRNAGRFSGGNWRTP